MRTPAPLGVAFPYTPALPPAFYRDGIVDFVEVTPETLCRQTHDGIELVHERVEQARRACDSLPIVVHGVELSIGSAHGWNARYVDMLERFQAVWPFRWHSEHLAFQTMQAGDGASLEIGVPLPLPLTHEAVSLVAQRCLALRERFASAFLLENPAHYLGVLPRDPDIADEVDFMNLVTAQGQCGELLDLHNLYCNAVNHGFDPYAALDRVALDRVVEIHVAGGSWRDGFRMDAHDGRVPAKVWDMLEYTLERAHNLAGIVFEMLDEHIAHVGVHAITQELTHVRASWDAFCARQARAA